MSLKIFNLEDKCTGCGACVSICPKNVISLEPDILGFYKPVLNSDKCINCHLCERGCHALNFSQPEKAEKNFKSFMLKAKDKDILYNSSSGGVFTLIANHLIREGGIVYGAMYDFDKEKLLHSSTDTCNLSKLQKSKYIESYLGDIFRDVATQLKSNRRVIFVGTPCQIDGLIRYAEIKKLDRNKLILIRFVCHGVPSNSFFTQYKHNKEAKYHSKMIYFDFRSKYRGWGTPTWHMRFENGVEIKDLSYYNYYYRAFYDNISLRPSCYSCKRIFSERADLTMADFWGLKYYKPEISNNEGVSLILSHTKKGDDLLRAISNTCNMEKIPQSAMEYIFVEAASHNKYEPDSKIFFNDVTNDSGNYMPTVIKRYRNPIIKQILRNKIHSIVSPVLRWLRK